MAPMLIQELVDAVAPPTRLDLTPVENTLRRLLLDVAKHADESPADAKLESQVELPDSLAKQPVILRFTGGWVRDKLLGVQSHDIDVAINKMTGYQFGLRMKGYLEIPGNLEKYGLESLAANEKQSQKAGSTNKSKTVGGLHKIEANPEKSKHLETTTMRILGLDIDLVNLRKETYSDDSRNPQIEFGSPEEDALRRDATVNAMFYNINDEKIEDFTGQGHMDMRKKLIRTPLEPYQTFKDDPLRVLRLIRFASRLGYTIDPAALQSMSNAEIKHELRRKISRERVGTEIEKALQGPDPHEAMRLVYSLGLYETIWCDPVESNADHYIPDTNDWQILIDTLRDLLNSGSSLQETLVRDEDEQYLAWQLAAVLPYRDAPQPEPTEPGKKPPPPTAVAVAREGIKAPNKVSDLISAAVRHETEISDLVDKVYERKRRPDKKFEGEDATARDVLGMAVRRWGPSWRAQVVYSLLVEVANNPTQIQPTERKYSDFVNHLRDLDLLEAHTFKPLMDGKALAKAIGISPGPWMKDALDVVMAWQLRNPGSTDSQQAVDEVKNHQEHGELTSNLIRHFLKLTIRPLFIKAAPKSVTDQGRKVTSEQLPEKLTMQSMDEKETKPWKNPKDRYLLEILSWVIKSLDERLLAEVWPLIIPPLLTLLDDWETDYKQIGTTLVAILLQKTPTSLLERTGLGDVFEQALMPCLTFLPTITPEQETIALLSSAYPALLTLAKVRYPHDNTGPNTTVSYTTKRIKLLDCVVRKGIIYGYAHCISYTRILSLLSVNLATYLDELGIDSVKHIKYILPSLAQMLAHPTSNADVVSQISATLAMQALLRNCWPRMPDYRGEVLKGLVLCWLAVVGIEGGEVVELRERLKQTVRMLKAIVEKDCDFQAECGSLIAADQRLEGLFR